MLTLYIREGACSLSPHIALHESGATFTTISVDLGTKLLNDGSSYLAINPKGQIPALMLDDGTLITEGPVISQYIADTYPSAALLPPVGQIDRYRVLEWLNFVATELHKTLSPLNRPGISDEFRQAITATADMKFRIVDRHLQRREYLTDHGFSIADAYLFVVASWMPRLNIERSDYVNLSQFSNRIALRPSVVAAIHAEKNV